MMKLRLAILGALCLSLVATGAIAATVPIYVDGLPADGWKATTTYVWGGSTNATVDWSEDYGASSARFFAGSMPVSWEFQWASISTDAFAGKTLASLSSLKIRNFGAFGDNQNNWQPPTFTFVLDKGDVEGNQRCIQWVPWTNGNAREPLVWHEYDAAVTGQWVVEETGVVYDSLAALKAALPNAYFEYFAQLPLDWGYASRNAFNIGLCPLYDEDRARYSGVAGYIDWFEVGWDGDVTKYDLVPEPSSLLALVSGIGVLGFVRRKK